MAKKVLVISTSLRERSNSEALADAFAEGAKAAGNAVEKISLRGKRSPSAGAVWHVWEKGDASYRTMRPQSQKK